MGRGRPVRVKILKALRRLPHRYNRMRVLGMCASLGILVAVPLTGLARVDLWGGRHALLFEPTDWRHGLAGVIVGISAMYVVTFLSNLAAGRMFCGWGCPVGQISRMGEVIDTPRISGVGLWRARAEGAAFSMLFVLSIMAWWVDLRMLWAGSAQALAIGWSIVVVSVLWAYLHGRFWRWDFCKSACPIGLYYSFVSPASWYGIHFRNGQSSCIECNACDNVCPVDLAPRDLMRPVPARAGISIADAPGRNHCLECGDCVRACEWMIERKGEGPVPLLLGYYQGGQRVIADSPGPVCSEQRP